MKFVEALELADAVVTTNVGYDVYGVKLPVGLQYKVLSVDVENHGISLLLEDTDDEFYIDIDNTALKGCKIFTLEVLEYEA